MPTTYNLDYINQTLRKIVEGLRNHPHRAKILAMCSFVIAAPCMAILRIYTLPPLRGTNFDNFMGLSITTFYTCGVPFFLGKLLIDRFGGRSAKRLKWIWLGVSATFSLTAMWFIV